MKQTSRPARALRQPEVITSRENQWVQRFRAALAGERERGEATIGIEGLRLVEEVLRSGLPMEAVLVSESGRKHLGGIAGQLASSTKLLAVPDRIFAKLSDTKNPQGIAALVRPKPANFDDIVRGTDTLIAVMCGVQDPGNVGTILRTAEALGATGAAACAADRLHTAHVHSPKVIRASAGAALRFPVVEGVASGVLLAQLKISGVKSIAASLAQSEDEKKSYAPWELDLRGPIAIFIGNEGAGLPADVEKSVDALVHIPMVSARGINVESLNAAMAATILLYEAARQRSAEVRAPREEQRISTAAHRMNL
jgi:RNA methyltransferase, TrmH family